MTRVIVTGLGSDYNAQYVFPRLPRRRSSHALGRQRALEELVRATAIATDTRSLRSLVCGHLVTVSGCYSAVLLEATSQDPGFRVTWPEPAPEPPISIDATGPMVSWLRVNEIPMEYPGRSGLAGFLSESERTQLTGASVRVAIPIFSVGHLRAVVLLVAALDWTPSPDLLAFLMTCGRHSGLAFETLDRHEAQISHAQSEAHTQRLAMAGQFAAMVAHEVRNPLAVVRAAVQLVRDTNPDEAQRQSLLGDALAEIDRISETISGFLSLSRPASVDGSIVDIIEIVTDAIRIVDTYAINRAIAIKSRFSVQQVFVWGDSRELRQVFLNILLNAAQAIEGDGFIWVDVDLVNEPSLDGSGHQTMVRIQIADNGPGITPDLLSRIFEPFVSTKPTGTGLGLPICSQITERHGGRLRVESAPEMGTTMSVYLPIRTVS